MWMRRNAEVVRKMLMTAVDSLSGAVRPSALAGFDDFAAGRAPFDQWIWRVISAGAWAQRFGVQI